MVIYEALNKINGKRYIGKTVVDFQKRKSQHLRDKSTQGFHGALKKYGHENFEWSILAHVDSFEELNRLEVYYIQLFQTYVGFADCKGYNRTLGGDGASPGKLNPWARDDVIRRLSEAKRGIPLPAETKAKISRTLTGRTREAESTAKTLDTQRKNRAAGLHKDKTGSNNPSSKTWIVTFPDGHEEQICGLRAFCRTYQLNAKLLRAVANGKWSQHKGFKLRAA